MYGGGLLAVAALVYWMTGEAYLAAAPVVLAGFFLWFFRDPARRAPEGEGLVISPADGKVHEAEWIETREGAYIRVSIFLSVFDVHVNRIPESGTVTNVEYIPGAFHNAIDSDSALHNEQTVVTVDTGEYTYKFKQIAGLLARRIVCRLHPGDVVHRGERMGLIKFGSRTDILLPARAMLKIKKGQRVKGGSSVIARVPPETETQ